LTARRLAIAVWLTILPALAAAQPIEIGEQLTIRSTTLNEERAIFVRTPRDYAGGRSRYPVLYLTDGEAQFAHTAATVAFLARADRMPEMIVVAIGNTDRTRDLTPTKATITRPDGSPMEFPTAGGADRFLTFIASELRPFIDGRYRTAPFSVFAGHSFGGLFAMHAFTTRPETFDAYIAVAPTLTWDDDLPVRRTAELLRDRRELRKTLIVTMGDEPVFDAALSSLRKTLSGSTPAGFEWEIQRFDDEDHGSVVMRSHYVGLRKVFDRWRLPVDPTGSFQGSFADFEKHYGALSDRMGYAITPPEGTVNSIGYGAMQAGRLDEALRYFELNVRNYPDSANVYDSLGEGLEAAGKLEQARERYGEAVKRGEAAKDPLLDAFKQHLAAITKKIKTSI
jgi:predicted alpha/beta superfamily hydrolase